MFLVKSLLRVVWVAANNLYVIPAYFVWLVLLRPGIDFYETPFRQKQKNNVRCVLSTISLKFKSSSGKVIFTNLNLAKLVFIREFRPKRFHKLVTSALDPAQVVLADRGQVFRLAAQHGRLLELHSW
jgi:hypothetical protein